MSEKQEVKSEMADDRCEKAEVKSERLECVFCGCTQFDCSQCVDKTGQPCYWICKGLCSACVKDVKALSIRQPWAGLIVNGYKPIENRTWRTSYRGPFLIHAGKTFESNAFGYINSMLWELDTSIDQEGISTNKDDYRLGGFVGIARLTDCVDEYDHPFSTGPHGFVLDDVHPIEFIEYPGSLSFFDVPDSVVSQIQLLTNNQ